MFDKYLEFIWPLNLNISQPDLHSNPKELLRLLLSDRESQKKFTRTEEFRKEAARHYMIAVTKCIGFYVTLTFHGWSGQEVWDQTDSFACAKELISKLKEADCFEVKEALKVASLLNLDDVTDG